MFGGALAGVLLAHATPAVLFVLLAAIAAGGAALALGLHDEGCCDGGPRTDDGPPLPSRRTGVRS